MKSAHTAPASPKWKEAAFPAAFGVFLGLCLLKFGNPPIMEKLVSPPTNIYEFVLTGPWPIWWAHVSLAVVVILGAYVWRWKTSAPRAVVLLPLAWFVWQLMAASRTVDSELTGATLPHFGICALCFYLGLLALGRSKPFSPFWIGLICCFFLVLLAGTQQRFGGLKETRGYFFTYIYPTLNNVPEEYLRKMMSDRIFATLFYPNTLAAAIILLLPVTGVVVYRWAGGGRFTPAARIFLTCVPVLLGMACLFWSRSKGGWLVMMLVCVLGFLHWGKISKRIRLLTVAVIMLAGLGGFFWTYSAFFKKGAPSVGARFDYWRAALQTAESHPIHGTGPGTFAVPYAKIKSPDSEMARLAHNDYLQQASDSGVPGFLMYTAFVCGVLWLGYKVARPRAEQMEDAWVRFAVWLGVFGWAIHSLMEFNLYIPAISWTAFALLGWLLSAWQPEPKA